MEDVQVQLFRQELEKELREKKESVRSDLVSYKTLIEYNDAEIEKSNGNYYVNGERVAWPGHNVLGRVFRKAEINGLDEAAKISKELRNNGSMIT